MLTRVGASENNAEDAGKSRENPNVFANARNTFVRSVYAVNSLFV